MKTDQAGEGKAESRAPSPRVPPLKDRRACARYVALLIRAGHRDEIALDKVRTLVYATQVLASLYAEEDIESRLERLEREYGQA